MANNSKFQPYVDLPVPVEMAFAYHDRPGALNRLMPPWESVEIESSDQSLAPGSRVVMKMSVLGIGKRWVAEHTKYDPPHLFEDIQVSGPFKSWRHQHQFSETESGCRLTDSITYQVPLGSVGKTFGGGLVRQKLEAMFAYRHTVTRGDLKAIANGAIESQKIAVSGATGLVGSPLSAFLNLAGHKVVRLVREPARNENEIFAWGDAVQGQTLGSLDSVIHLAGESIAASRWNPDVKRRIRDSRIDKTRQLCEKLAAFEKPPKTLLCASATGIYGDRGEDVAMNRPQRVTTSWQRLLPIGNPLADLLSMRAYGLSTYALASCFRRGAVPCKRCCCQPNLAAVVLWGAAVNGGVGLQSMT